MLADGYKTSTIKLWHNTATTNSPSGQTTYTYDANMQVKKVADLQDVAKNRRYVTDANGVTYARADGVPDATGEITLTDSSINVSGADHPRVQHMLVVNGQTLGLNAKAIGSDVPSIARFDFGTHGGSAASDTPGHYVLTTTDAQRGLASLKSIAQAVYGDSSLWYVIADANGITENGQLTAGMSLTLPANVSSARNDANTFRPYDPAEIKGDNMPSLPHPQADQGCGAMGQIIVAIVVIVVAVITQQYYVIGEANAAYAAAFVAPTDGAFAASAYVSALEGSQVVGAAIGAAAGNIAGQAVGNAIGVQDGFSWQSLAASVASAGVTSGLSLPGGALNNLGADAAGIAARAAVNSAVNQGINVALGQQRSFSWAAVAASAVAAPLASGIAGEVGKVAGDISDPLAGRIIGAFTYGVTTQAAVKAATGGKMKWENIAADAFGNALGQSLGESLAGGSQQAVKMPASGYADNDEGYRLPGHLVGRDNPDVAMEYTSAGDDYFKQFADAFQQPNSPVEYGQKFAMDADRAARDFMIRDEKALRGLRVDPRTGKPSFAFTSWAESDVENGLFGDSLLQRTNDSRAFYVSPGGAAFGNPILAGQAGSGSRFGNSLDGKVARALGGYLSIADASVWVNEAIGPQSLPGNVEGMKGVMQGGIAAAAGGWQSVPGAAGGTITSGPIRNGVQSLIVQVAGGNPAIMAAPAVTAPSLFGQVAHGFATGVRNAPLLSVAGTAIEYGVYDMAGTAADHQKSTARDFAVDATLDVQKGIVAGGGGAAAGAAAGAMVGSFVPGAGTAVGALFGLGVGYLISVNVEDAYQEAGSRNYFKDKVRRW